MPLAIYGSGSLSLSDGRPISFARILETQPWVAAAVNGLGRQIARLPWKSYALAGDADGNRSRDRSSGLAELMRRPDPVHARSPMLLKWEITQGVLTNGNHLERVHRPGAGRPPNRLTRLDWRFVVPHLEHQGGPVLGWEYRPPDGPAEWLGPEEVVHFAWSAATGPIGISPLAQLAVSLRAEDAVQRHTEAYFRNGTRMGVAAVLDKNVSADQVVRDGLRAELDAVHGGVDKAFRNPILGGGIIDLKPIGGQTAVEAELIRQRELNREEIAAVYSMPPPLLGILDNATLANVDAFAKILHKHVTPPWTGLLSDIANAGLVDRVPAWRAAELFLEFDHGDVLKGDPKERMDAYRVAIAAGVLTLNDVRRLENLKPYGDPGDPDNIAEQPLVMANNVLPLSLVGKDAGEASSSVSKALEAMVRSTLEELLEERAGGDAD